MVFSFSSLWLTHIHKHKRVAFEAIIHNSTVPRVSDGLVKNSVTLSQTAASNHRFIRLLLTLNSYCKKLRNEG
jgi:hypothetical protein